MGEPTAGIEMDVRDGLAILRPWGALDLEGSTTIRPQLDQLIRAATARSFLVDLQQVNFLDVSGLRELLRVRDSIRSMGGQISIINGKPHVRRLLAIIGRVRGKGSCCSLSFLGTTRR
jgi:stage II sporulation protein AA (anti-sigma F factor antagonist)